MSGGPKMWVPPRGVALLRHHASKRTTTLPDGRRALVTIDDSGTVEQIETADQLDAIVRPRTVRIQIRPRGGAS